jgi:hypothetical protein
MSLGSVAWWLTDWILILKGKFSATIAHARTNTTSSTNILFCTARSLATDELGDYDGYSLYDNM